MFLFEMVYAHIYQYVELWNILDTDTYTHTKLHTDRIPVEYQDHSERIC